MSTIFIDRDGDPWPKDCNTCDRLESYSRRKDDMTTCLAFGVSIRQDPVKSYYEARSGQNTCPKYYTTGQ